MPEHKLWLPLDQHISEQLSTKSFSPTVDLVEDQQGDDLWEHSNILSDNTLFFNLYARIADL